MLNDTRQRSLRRKLRQRMTAGERTLWSKLRAGRLAGYKFRRQTSIDQYIVDFYCAAAKLILEIDGDVHGFKERRESDRSRQKHLESLGFKVLRFTNGEVKYSIEGVSPSQRMS